jgi:hypothetical protein
LQVHENKWFMGIQTAGTWFDKHICHSNESSKLTRRREMDLIIPKFAVLSELHLEVLDAVLYDIASIKTRQNFVNALMRSLEGAL